MPTKPNYHRRRKPIEQSAETPNTESEVTKNARIAKAAAEKEKLIAFNEALRLYTSNPVGEAPTMPEELAARAAVSPAPSDESDFVVVPNQGGEYDLMQTMANLRTQRKPASPITGQAAMFQLASKEPVAVPAQQGGVLSYLASFVPGFSQK